MEDLSDPVWTDQIAIRLSEILDRLRSDKNRTPQQKSHDVQRLRNWLNSPDGTVFVVDGNDWGTNTPVLRAMNGKIILTQGYHTEWGSALLAMENLDQTVVRAFSLAVDCYLAGYVGAQLQLCKREVTNAESNDQE